MAQQVEQFTRNEQVASSNLASSSSSGAKETLLRFFVKKLHHNPCSFAITKNHARFDCSVVNALATSHCRYQLFARVLTTFAKVNRRCISRQRKLCSVFLSKNFTVILAPSLSQKGTRNRVPFCVIISLKSINILLIYSI